MDVDILFFASYRDLTGTPGLRLTLPPGATVEELVRTVRERGEAFLHLPARPAVAVNHTVVPHGHVLTDGDEVAFLPPVAGG
ncbi:MAG: molybdopterin converting factor subunit 1 [Longimicrobiales bacterium]|nr:molybdopterin converting factor subunit 1 [Longimicrobiales bacterium]